MPTLKEILQNQRNLNLGTATSIDRPHGLLEILRSKYQKYIPEWGQDLVSNAVKLGDFMGLNDPMTALSGGAIHAAVPILDKSSNISTMTPKIEKTIKEAIELIGDSKPTKLETRVRNGITINGNYGQMQDNYLVGHNGEAKIFNQDLKGHGQFHLWGDNSEWAIYDNKGNRIRQGEARYGCAPSDKQLESWDKIAKDFAKSRKDIPKESYFIRHGDPPLSGRSHNDRYGITEKGVSVYPAEYDPVNKVYKYGPDIDPAAFEYMSSIFESLGSYKKTYLVKGRVVGKGSDGEPVLRDIKIVKPLAMDPSTGGWKPIDGPITKKTK